MYKVSTGPNRSIVALLLLIMITILGSCTSDGNKANLLNPQVKYNSDTMFAHHSTEIRKEMDSLCVLREKDMLQNSIDSILQRSTEQINAIINPSSN